MTMPTITPIPSSDLTDSQKILVYGLALSALQTKAEKHEKILVEGNGERPLVERVRNLEAYIESTKYWVRFLAGAILLQTVAFAGAAIVYFVRLYPLLNEIANKANP